MIDAQGQLPGHTVALEGLKASAKGPCFLSAEEPGSLKDKHILTTAKPQLRNHPSVMLINWLTGTYQVADRP